MKIVEFANSIDPDEAARNNKPPHLDSHCLPSFRSLLNRIYFERNTF